MRRGFEARGASKSGRHMRAACLLERVVQEDGADEHAAERLDAVRAVVVWRIGGRRVGAGQSGLRGGRGKHEVRDEDGEPAHDRQRLEDELRVRLLLVHERVPEAPCEQDVAADEAARVVAGRDNQQAADALHDE
eukprot:7382072-Prymnesium_polylepis.1